MYGSIPYILGLALAFFSLQGCKVNQSSQGSAKNLNYITIQQLPELMNLEKRPIVVFLYAPWCTFCENMKQTTFRNTSIIEELNNRYYFISFNGEQKEELRFRNKQYRYLPTGRDNGTHELAQELGSDNGHLVYPTTIIMNTNYQVVFRNSSFISGDELLAILNTR